MLYLIADGKDGKDGKEGRTGTREGGKEGRRRGYAAA
jgi:hypothetical protein